MLGKQNGYSHKKRKQSKLIISLGGGGGNRTRVQTYPSKAFYMLISLLFVGDEQEMNQPIHHLAG